MPDTHALIAAWARTAVVARHGAFKHLHMQDLAKPVIHTLLQRSGLQAQDIDTVVVGNALGAGGNPARLIALHAGLPEQMRALSVDTQCCAGLDAVALGVSLIQAGQAHVVIAGGVEAWSRAPIRMHRPLNPQEPPTPYDRPAFAPTPEQDPDMLQAAALYAQAHHHSRYEQEAYALNSHVRACQNTPALQDEITPILGVTHDTHPRLMDATRAARMPEVAPSLSALTVSPPADGAAFVLLLSPHAAQQLQAQTPMSWMAHRALGGTPQTPMLAAQLAMRSVLQHSSTHVTDLAHLELHDAFAVQGLSFCAALGLEPSQINAKGGGLARGHPIGASGAIALVRLLSDLQCHAATDAIGGVAIAGAGGLGSAALIHKRVI